MHHSGMGWFVPGIILGALLIVVWELVRRLRSKKVNKTEQSPATTPPDPRSAIMAEVDAIIGRLVDLRLELAISAVDQTTLRVFDSILDVLRPLLPRMRIEHGGSDLTFAITRIAKTHLHELLANYLRLSPENRGAEKPKLEQALSTMYEELAKIQQMIETQDTSRFTAEANFLNNRFSSSSVEAAN